MILSKILDIFREPSAFKDDPLNWAYSQIGHGYLGCAMTSFVTFAVLFLTGEYPDAMIIALSVTAAYFLWWELDLQGWNGWDSVEDAIFFGLGASLFIVIDMSEVIGRLTVWFAITGGAVLLGVARRL